MVLVQKLQQLVYQEEKGKRREGGKQGGDALITVEIRHKSNSKGHQFSEIEELRLTSSLLHNLHIYMPPCWKAAFIYEISSDAIIRSTMHTLAVTSDHVEGNSL